MKSLLRIAAFLLLSSAANAAPWKVDAAASTLTFTGTQAGDPFRGGFKLFTPVIELDPANPEKGTIRVTIDIASAYVEQDKDKNASLANEEWFATKQFPTAQFVATRISRDETGKNTYTAEGDLTLRGLTKPIALSFTLDIVGNIATAKGNVTLSRHDFGIGQGKEWESDQWIAYPVKVNFTVVASR